MKWGYPHKVSVGAMMGMIYFYIYSYFLPVFFIKHKFEVIPITERLECLLLAIFLVVGVIERIMSGYPGLVLRLSSKIVGSLVMVILLRGGLIPGVVSGFPVIVDIRGVLVTLVIISILIGIIDGVYLNELHFSSSNR